MALPSRDVRPADPGFGHPPRPAEIRPERDVLTTIRRDGSRRFLHPADVSGRFTRARRLSGLALIAIYLTLPWIPVGGHPAVFFDLAARRFHLFGLTLAFQDAWLLFFAISGLGFALFFVTALLGRVWCGWACPHVVFLDHVFRRVERWIDGDASRRRALDAAPWNTGKLLRRGCKHAIYLGLALGLAHLFLAYFVSLPGLGAMMLATPAAHPGAFAFVFVLGGVLYFDFAWFREQLCLILCPYGRLQSALIDDHSLVIGYDSGRGEPRGKVGIPDAGACVDCNRCVQVCPTGIDIRHGLQMECIGCVACVDVCDTVMDKLHRPRGLIRYASLASFAGGKTRWWRARTVVYAALLVIGAAVASWAFSTVRPANLEVTRLRGAPYFVDTDAVRNQFLVRLVNKRDEPLRVALALPDAPAGLVHNGFEHIVELAPLAEEVRPLVLQMPRDSYQGTFHLRIVVSDEAGSFSLARAVEFVGPDMALWREEAVGP